MNKLISVIGIVLLASPTNVMAEIYRCVVAGKVLYTDRQCADAEPVPVKEIDPKKQEEALKRLEELKKQRAEEREAETKREQARAERQTEIEAQRRAAELERRRAEELLGERVRQQRLNRSIWDNY